VKITRIESLSESLELARPYRIATRNVTHSNLFFVRLVADDGTVGLGSASPGEHVTGESPRACEEALDPSNLDWLVGRDIEGLGQLLLQLSRRLPRTPAARAAIDVALHDLFCQRIDVPLVEFLGRHHDSLPTSITIGIKSVEETLADAREYLERGFRHIKTKIGLDWEQDLERLSRLRELVGAHVNIRVDANQGYTFEQASRLIDWVEQLDLELVEQPLPVAEAAEMRRLPEPLRRLIAADESLHDVKDALVLAADPAACGIFNIKMMKCGGIGPALEIARVAAAAGIDLMWGCNDESRITTTAALHVAYACSATRYLDLDGSFDLGRDLAAGGYTVSDGRMFLPDAPGLGVTWSG